MERSEEQKSKRMEEDKRQKCVYRDMETVSRKHTDLQLTAYGDTLLSHLCLHLVKKYTY